jgi:hypothetical protein
VRTNIVNAERNRPAELRNEPVTMRPEMQAGLAVFKAAIEAGMPPRQVADVVFDAIQKEQFYILSHPDWTEVIQLRTDKLLRMENPQSPASMIAKLITPRPVRDEMPDSPLARQDISGEEVRGVADSHCRD